MSMSSAPGNGTAIPTGDPRHGLTTDDKSHRIELELREISQLFNSMDPSPFNDKDLDHDAEEFIVSWAREYSPDEPITLRIHLEQWRDEDPVATLQTAIHNFFAYRAKLNQLQFRRLMKEGQVALVIGLGFLASCLVGGKMLVEHSENTWAYVMHESLTIAGWVAMWRPMQIYLHEWWPLYQQGRTYAKLSQMPIEVIRRTKGPAADLA